MLHTRAPVSYTHLKDELNTIKYLAESNGYDRTIVSKLLHKTQNKQQTKTENNKFITLTYINNHTEKIAYKFKKAYKTTNKTEHLSLIHIYMLVSAILFLDKRSFV